MQEKLNMTQQSTSTDGNWESSREASAEVYQVVGTEVIWFGEVFN